MAFPRNFHRKKFKCKPDHRRSSISKFFLPLIIFTLSIAFEKENHAALDLQIDFNIFKQNPFYNTVKSYPQFIQYINQRTASVLTISYETQPRIKVWLDLIDVTCNQEMTESYDNGIIYKTRTKFQQQGSSSNISPTKPLRNYAYKKAIIIPNNRSLRNRESIHVKPLKKITNNSEAKKKDIVFGKKNPENIDNNNKSENFGADYLKQIVNNNFSQSSFTYCHLNNSNGLDAYLDNIKLEKFNHNQMSQTIRYVANKKINVNGIENLNTEQIRSIFNKCFDNPDIKVKHLGVYSNHTERIISRNQVKKQEHVPYTNYSKLHNMKLKSASSLGIAMHPSKLIMILSFMLMYPLASTSSAGLSATFPGSIISNEDLNRFKVIHCLNTVGQAVLLDVYQLFKKFDDTKSIKDHLLVDLHMPEYKFKDAFNTTMIQFIERTPNSGEDYDISLLVKCIRVLSNHYEPSAHRKWRDDSQLECRCQKLADKRNQVFHSFSGISIPDMTSEINAIEKLLMDVLTSLEDRFPGDSGKINDIKKHTHERVSHILAHPLMDSEVRTYVLQRNLKLFRDEIPAYKDKCKDWGKLQILDFLLGSKLLHEVKLLFTEVIVEKSNKQNKNIDVKCTDILKRIASSILLIDAEAGGGKTTVFQYGINDWGEGGLVMGTSEYDFIFPMEFRNPHIFSVKGLIEKLIPNVRTSIGMEDIMTCIGNPSLKILFFCDGYDEKNENSRKLFREICELKERYPHIKVAVTSRPESVREFYREVGRKYSIEHLKVLGIHESKRGEFLKRYHDEMVTAGLSKQSSDDLLHFYASCSARHKELYRLPINLVILAWLWGLDPERAKRIKSAAGLYRIIVDILNKKLVSRIVESHPEVMNRLKGDVDALQDLIDSFQEKIYYESLVAVRWDRIYIEDASVRKLRDFCNDVGLPFLELKGAYLLAKLEWENIDDLKEILELPHTGLLDYYSAKFIESKLCHLAKESEFPHKANESEITEASKSHVEKSSKFNMFKIFRRKNRNKENSKAENKLKNSRENIIEKIILDIYGKDCEKFDLPKYQNILQLLGGILALNNDSLVEKHGQEIINLLIRSGINNNTQWYDVYSDVNLNPPAAVKYGNLIAPHLNLENFTIKDGDLEVLITLLRYVTIDKVTFDIVSIDVSPYLPTLINILAEKQCKVSIKSIIDDQLKLWNSVIQLNNNIDIKYVEMDISSTDVLAQVPSLINSLISKKCFINISKKCQIHIYDIFDNQIDLLNNIMVSNNGQTELGYVYVNNEQSNFPFLSYCKSINECQLQYLWRECLGTSTDMSRCNVIKMWTAVRFIEHLPKTLLHLKLGLLVNPTTNSTQDPGLSRLKNHCQMLEYLDVNVKVGTATEHLPHLPIVSGGTKIFLSPLNDDSHVNWAVTTARILMPDSGYSRMVLPSCGLQINQLCELVVQLAAAEVTMEDFWVSSPHSVEEQIQLEEAISTTTKCDFQWYDFDEELNDYDDEF